MKYLCNILLISLLFFSFSITSYAQKNALSYLALGDSYTIGHKVTEKERWPVQLAKTLREAHIKMDDPKIIAKNGWTTVDLRKAIARADIHQTYDLVSLLIGVNDQYDGLNFDDYPARFTYLLKKAITFAGGKPNHVLVVSIPDYGVTPFGQQKNPAKIKRELNEYNATNKAISEKMGVHYVNITPGSEKAAEDAGLVASDGLHPSGKMYAQWVDEILPVILPEVKN